MHIENVSIPDFAILSKKDEVSETEKSDSVQMFFVWE
jgi:hypothetical protein